MSRKKKRLIEWLLLRLSYKRFVHRIDEYFCVAAEGRVEKEMSMEGEPEESDEDTQGEDKPTVLWEKCIQQSIIVDLSEDESLHLSDLESSLALHVSRAESAASEASINLTENVELSDFDDTSSGSSAVSSQSKRVVENKTSSSIMHVPAQRPNTMQDGPPLNHIYEDPGQNTSDEDQEELPYDGDLGSLYFNQAAYSEDNMSPDGRETIHSSPDVPGLAEFNTTHGDDIIGQLVSAACNAEKPASYLPEDTDTKQNNASDVSKPHKVSPSSSSHVHQNQQPDINQLLLRHFSKEELLHSGRLIEAETLPEVSLLESVDDTLFSWAPKQSIVQNVSEHTESPACNSESNQSFCSERTDEKSCTASTDLSLVKEGEEKLDNVTSTPHESITSNSSSTSLNQESVHSSTVDAVMWEKNKEEHQDPKVPFLRTRSFTEMKYGQGQVHYPLPDFSKVAPKVKIPKAPSGPSRPTQQTPCTIHRAQSSPGMLDVISRVLEDSVQAPERPYVFKEQDKQTSPELVEHLQAEYDKLLTKYAEAENLIDQMRLGINPQPSSDLMLYFESEDDQGNLVEGGHLGLSAPRLPPSENNGEKMQIPTQSNITELNTVSSSEPEIGPSDGEQMTTELKNLISQFMQSVEDFKLNVINMSINIDEQQMMVRSMMEAQDQLERKYMSKKEEHRALEMQNYMGLCRNTGTFDPNRLVEGDIFRIGMHLEDIKEMIDRHVCEQISPPQFSSTPLPRYSPEKPSPLCMPSPSPPPSLHEEQSSFFSTVRYEMGEEEEEETGSCGDVGLKQSNDLINTGSSLENIGQIRSYTRSSPGFQEQLVTPTAEDEKENEEEGGSVLSEGFGHSDILAYLSGTSSSSGQRQWTPESCRTQVSVLNPEGECDLGDCVSLAVEVSCSTDAPRDQDQDSQSVSEPPLNTSSASQRIVSPETDSGFGSSYLSQSASGSLQQNLFIESPQSQNEGLSSSDSEGSCSNLQTTIHSAKQQWADSHPTVQSPSGGATATVELWVESTTKEPSLRLQGADPNLPAQLHHHVSEPTLSTTMDVAERGSQLYSCTCNSEAILALQAEVSRLKKDLEDGLVQLPHLTQQMDYLTSKYRHERQDRRSKTRPKRPASNSVLKPSSSRQNLSSSQVKLEDWISSDMDPSKSKGTDSGDTAGSELMLQFHISPVGSRRGSNMVLSGPEFETKVQRTVQSNRESNGNIPVKTSGLTSSSLNSHTKQRSQTLVGSFNSKDRWSQLPPPTLQKPLLQVSYGSSSSLPASSNFISPNRSSTNSYKVKEPPLQSMSHHWKRFTQSDTALLPSNVYFQQTLSPVSVPSKAGGRTGRRRGSREEDLNRTLDQAIEAARNMKRTTDRIAKSLSADLAKAQLHKKLYTMSPLGGRKHHAL